jgi:hypothetical protein
MGPLLTNIIQLGISHMVEFNSLLSTWCRVAAFFSASGAALSQEIPTVE